ncbi:CatB-related O-acetyltransferase [Salegentibacter sp. HM20]
MKSIIQRIRILLYFLKINSKPKEQPPFHIKSHGQIISKGRNSVHNGNFVVKGKGGVLEIGGFCAIGVNVTVILANHYYDFPAVEFDFYKKYFGKYPYTIKNRKNRIGSDVWIGDNVVILPEVNIGNGAIIGAGAIVTKDVPPYAIVGGNPAKIIKYRFSESVTQELLDSKWWEWDDSKIKENKDFFFRNLNQNN